MFVTYGLDRQLRSSNRHSGTVCCLDIALNSFATSSLEASGLNNYSAHLLWFQFSGSGAMASVVKYKPPSKRELPYSKAQGTWLIGVGLLTTPCACLPKPQKYVK